MKTTQCQRILMVLSDHQPHTMEEIHERAGMSRLNSRISDLRRKGYPVAPCRYENGHYVYQLLPEVLQSPENSLTDGEPVGARASGAPLPERSATSEADPGPSSLPPSQGQLLIWSAA